MCDEKVWRARERTKGMMGSKSGAEFQISAEEGGQVGRQKGAFWRKWPCELIFAKMLLFVVFLLGSGR
jgi:hypothetical protein